MIEASGLIGSTLTFDMWRQRYDELSYAEHLAFYEALYEVYPNQDYGTASEAVAFGRQLPTGVRILELGGWSGRLAGILLNECPQIEHWFNFEVCRPAVANGLRHLRYSATVPDDFIWNLPELPQVDVFFSTHTLEHLSESQLTKLLSRLTDATYFYAEVPLPPAGPVDWSGDTSTHVLKLGWRELEELFAQFGWKPHHANGDVRVFRQIVSRDRRVRDAVPHHVKLGQNVTVHPTANLYRSTIGDDTKIAAFAEVGGAQVGARCKIQAHAFLCPGVTIEDEVFVGPGVRFTNDLYPRAVGNWTVTPTRVEKGASIGAGAIILAGVTIGAQALVGAGSVVTSDVAPRMSVTGNPARKMGGGVRSGNGRDVLIVLGDPENLAGNAMQHLPIDRVWFPAPNGNSLPDLLNRFIAETQYRNYLLISEDLIATPKALASVTELLQIRPAVTGYYRSSDQEPRINLPRSSELTSGGPKAGSDSTRWPWDEVQAFHGEFAAGFGGWSLVGMRRNLWLQYPFRWGTSSDTRCGSPVIYHEGCLQREFNAHTDAVLCHHADTDPTPTQGLPINAQSAPWCRWELHSLEGSAP